MPDYPWRLAWSPDNQTIAVTQFNKGELRLIDVKKRTVGEPILDHFNASMPLVWSPQGDYLLTAGPGSMRLFSTSDWHEVAQVRSPHDGCRFQTETPPAFTSDGAYIWVSCAQQNVHTRYTAALKLAIPSFRTADQLALVPPRVGRRTNVSHDAVRLQGLTVAFSTIIADYIPNKPGYPETPSYTLRAFDLGKGKELISPIDLGKFGWGGGFMIDTPIQAMMAVDDQVVAIRGWSKEYQITTISLETGQQLAALANANDQMFRGLNDMLVTIRGSLLIGAFGQITKDVGGLYVWNVATGTLLQVASNDPVSRIALSIDEKSLAAVVRNELVVYSLHSH